MQFPCNGHSVDQRTFIGRFRLAAAFVAAFLVYRQQDAGKFRKRNLFSYGFCAQAIGGKSCTISLFRENRGLVDKSMFLQDGS